MVCLLSPAAIFLSGGTHHPASKEERLYRSSFFVFQLRWCFPEQV